MKRLLAAPLVGATLFAGAALSPVIAGANAPGTQVPTLEEHTALADRVLALEGRVTTLESDGGTTSPTTTAPSPTTTAPSTTTTTAAPQPEPSTDGMWISAAELATKPTSGASWDNVRRAAGAFTSSMTDYTDQDSTDGTHALAAALVYARTGDSAMRTKVADAIQRIASSSYNTSNNPSALGWARTMTSWVVASDLIDLATLRPQVDAQWRTFLAGMPKHPYSGDGGSNLLDLAVSRANNIGAVARTAVTAIEIYTGDKAGVDQMAQLYRAFVEGSTVHRFDWAKDKDRSWHCQPNQPATYRGINAPCTRDGNDLGGVMADEYRRSGSYSASDFPGANTTKYPWEALGAVAVQAELLQRAGYADALSWGQQAPRRALERLYHLHTVAADDGWTFGRAAGGGSDDRWIIPFLNDAYGTSMPEPSSTGHGRPMSWTDWTH